MTEFLTILAFTYLCNSSAELRLVSLDEARNCTRAYEQVKRHFQPDAALAPAGTRQSREQNIAAYRAFKQWEMANAERVAAMKTEASRLARDSMAPNG